MGYTTDQEVDSCETLHRGVPARPVFWKDDGRPSSALFKDSQGVSVDVNANRSSLEVKNQLLSVDATFKGEARVSGSFCKEKCCLVLHAPIKGGNQFHSLILGQEKPELTKGQARALARSCDFVSYNAD